MDFNELVQEMSERRPYAPLPPIEAAKLAIRTNTVEEFNSIHCPSTSDFRDGQDAEGWFIGPNGIFQQVCGSPGVYLIEYDFEGRLVNDGRPWQMTV